MILFAECTANAVDYVRANIRHNKRCLTEQDYRDGKIAHMPQAKRHRTRSNRKNIKKEIWNYIDCETTRLEKQGLDWQVWVDNEEVPPQKVRKGRASVPLSQRYLRDHTPIIPPAPSQPPNCVVLPLWTEPIIDTSKSAVVTGKRRFWSLKSTETYNSESSAGHGQKDDARIPFVRDFGAMMKAFRFGPSPGKYIRLSGRHDPEPPPSGDLSWDPCNPLFQSEHSPILMGESAESVPPIRQLPKRTTTSNDFECLFPSMGAMML